MTTSWHADCAGVETGPAIGDPDDRLGAAGHDRGARIARPGFHGGVIIASMSIARPYLRQHTSGGVLALLEGCTVPAQSKFHPFQRTAESPMPLRHRASALILCAPLTMAINSCAPPSSRGHTQPAIAATPSMSSAPPAAAPTDASVGDAIATKAADEKGPLCVKSEVSASLSEDGRYLATSNGSIWDTASGQVVMSGPRYVYGTWSPDGTLWASGAVGLMRYDLKRGLMSDFGLGDVMNLGGFIFAEGGKRVYVGGYNGSLNSIDVKSGRVRAPNIGGDDCGWVTTLGPGEKTIIRAGIGLSWTHVHVLDARSLEELIELDSDYGGDPVSHKGNRVAYCDTGPGGEGRLPVALANIGAKKSGTALSPHVACERGGNLFWSPDDRYLVVFPPGGTTEDDRATGQTKVIDVPLWLYDARTAQRLATSTYTGDYVRFPQWSPDRSHVLLGQSVYSAPDLKRVRSWNAVASLLVANDEVARLDHKGDIAELTFEDVRTGKRTRPHVLRFRSRDVIGARLAVLDAGKSIVSVTLGDTLTLVNIIDGSRLLIEGIEAFTSRSTSRVFREVAPDAIAEPSQAECQNDTLASKANPELVQRFFRDRKRSADQSAPPSGRVLNPSWPMILSFCVPKAEFEIERLSREREVQCEYAQLPQLGGVVVPAGREAWITPTAPATKEMASWLASEHIGYRVLSPGLSLPDAALPEGVIDNLEALDTADATHGSLAAFKQLRRLYTPKISKEEASALRDLEDLELQSANHEVLIAIGNMTKLRRLKVVEPVDNDAITLLAKCTQLQSLHLHAKALKTEALVHFPKLRVFVSSSLTDLSSVPFGQLPELSVLDAGAESITDDMLASIAALPRLRKLSLSAEKISDAGFGRLAHAKTLQDLTLVGGFNESKHATDAAFGSVGQLTDLRTLVIRDQAFCSIGPRAFRQLQNLKELRQLSCGFPRGLQNPADPNETRKKACFALNRKLPHAPCEPGEL